MSVRIIECVDCGNTIPVERLAVNPHAKFCIDCQQEQEKSGKFQKHRMSTNIRFKNDEVESMESEIVRR